MSAVANTIINDIVDRKYQFVRKRLDEAHFGTIIQFQHKDGSVIDVVECSGGHVTKSQKSKSCPSLEIVEIPRLVARRYISDTKANIYEAPISKDEFDKINRLY